MAYTPEHLMPAIRARRFYAARLYLQRLAERGPHLTEQQYDELRQIIDSAPRS